MGPTGPNPTSAVGGVSPFLAMRGSEVGVRRNANAWFLHKFDFLYNKSTNLLRAGIDVRTVMKYAGHAGMATVLLISPHFAPR